MRHVAYLSLKLNDLPPSIEVILDLQVLIFWNGVWVCNLWLRIHYIVVNGREMFR
jgi:hypothetical protein